MKPFIKWYGGKRRVLPKIAGLLPEKITTYVEPFVGGGAVLLHVLQKSPPPASVIINDACAPLIATWQAVASNPRELLQKTEMLFTQYAIAQDKRAFHNRMRDDFNLNKNDASAFLFLNRTSFNGLFRLNVNSGNFNVPHVQHPRAPRIDAENVMALNRVLCRCVIMNGDFEATLRWAKRGAVFYFDPPYRGTPAGIYTEAEFSDAEHERLAAFVRKVHRLGATIIVSAGDTGDGFFERLYDGFSFMRFSAPQTSAHRVDSRRPRPEMIIHNTLS